MKEATGELNMTVITIVAIAAIAGFFAVVIYPGIKKNIEQTTMCASAACPASCNDTTCKCKYTDGNTEKEITCKNKNTAKAR